MGILGCVFMIAMAIGGIVILFKYINILTQLRGAIGEKIG
jgi:hypothetical protein